MPIKRRRVDPLKHDLTVCPAPAECVQVCKICRDDPETCGHNTYIKDRNFQRESTVWCCDWKPQDPPAKPPYPTTKERKSKKEAQ
jgi:hypothetical protein